MTERTIIELIKDEGEHAYDDLRRDYPTAAPGKVAALVEDVALIILEAQEIEESYSGDRFMSSIELAREHLWRADDVVAGFLREVA